MTRELVEAAVAHARLNAAGMAGARGGFLARAVADPLLGQLVGAQPVRVVAGGLAVLGARAWAARLAAVVLAIPRARAAAELEVHAVVIVDACAGRLRAVF